MKSSTARHRPTYQVTSELRRPTAKWLHPFVCWQTPYIFDSDYTCLLCIARAFKPLLSLPWAVALRVSSEYTHYPCWVFMGPVSFWTAAFTALSKRAFTSLISCDLVWSHLIWSNWTEVNWAADILSSESELGSVRVKW